MTEPNFLILCVILVVIMVPTVAMWIRVEWLWFRIMQKKKTTRS